MSLVFGLYCGSVIKKKTTFCEKNVFSDDFYSVFPEISECEVLDSGYQWLEGPVWVPNEKISGEGHLLFSDVINNTIYKVPILCHCVFGHQFLAVARWVQN
jgi:hypothetical protein